MIKASEVEAVARAICWSNGMNPDVSLGGDGVNFLWHEYDSQAKAAIHAYAEAIGSNYQTFPPKGWRLVPIEATAEMLEATSDAMSRVNDGINVAANHGWRLQWVDNEPPMAHAYRAMVSSAPLPSAQDPTK